GRRVTNPCGARQPPTLAEGRAQPVPPAGGTQVRVDLRGVPDAQERRGVPVQVEENRRLALTADARRERLRPDAQRRGPRVRGGPVPLEGVRTLVAERDEEGVARRGTSQCEDERVAAPD